MRCSCPVCSTYMVHAESHFLGCVCPQCGARCQNCLGTNTVIAKEDLGRLAQLVELDSEDQETPAPSQTRLEELEEADREARGKL